MASTRIYRTLAQNGDKKLTVSFWVKRAKLGATQEVVANWYSGSYNATIRFLSDDTLEFTDYRTSVIMKRATNRKFRDVNAWYHIVCNFDNSLGTPSQKVFVNGVEETSFASSTNYSQNVETSWNNDYTHEIGATNSANYFDGSLSDLYFIQGQQYDASTFAETDASTGEWKPKINPTINYGATGNNSYHLKFENSANMDLDSGDNTVSFTTAGSLTQTEDCPSNVFCTMNPLFPMGSNVTFSNGNTSISTSNTSFRMFASTFGISSGKFYWEMKPTPNAGGDFCHFGILDSGQFDNDTYVAVKSQGYVYLNDGRKNNNGTATSYGNSYGNNDIIGVALDMDNKKLYFAKNGTWQNSGVPTSGSTGTGAAFTVATPNSGAYVVAVSIYAQSGVTDPKLQYNFGNGYFGTTAVSSAGTNASGIGIFEYDVPTGYTALSTKGLNL